MHRDKEKVIIMEFQFYWFAGLILIGAAVGGGTNILAIQMLLRPHNAKYIGSFQVPFTPGLIPKRREEIADQLGTMVEEYLITPEGVARKIFEGEFLEEAEGRIKVILETFLQQELTVEDWLKEHIGDTWSTKAAREAYERAIKGKMLVFFNDYKNKKINDMLQEEWKDKIEDYIPEISAKVLEKGEEYFQSPEGRDQVDQMVSRFFETKGSFGGMIGRFTQRVSFSSLVSKELTKLFRDERAHEYVTYWIRREWHEMLEKTPEDYIKADKLEDNVHYLVQTIVDETPIIGEWDRPLKEWAHQYEKVITYTMLPAFVDGFTQVAERQLKSVMKRIGIKGIVSDQVNNFPLENLEEMVLKIAKRELKMIAVLGALIGAVAGLVQALFILFIS